MQGKNVNINIDSSVKPLYADEVAIACSIKQEKDEKGDVKREGSVSLVFLDMIGQGVVTRVTLSKTTAKALAGILKTNIEELEKKLSSNEDFDKQVKIEETRSDDYIG